MRSLLVSDFENMNLPLLEDDVSLIISLNSAFDILLACEKKELDYSTLPDNLKGTIDTGLSNGITEIEKIKGLLNKNLGGRIENKERVYLYLLLKNFTYLSRNDLVAEISLKDKLSITDEETLDNAMKRLDSLLNDLTRLKDHKRIKNTELAEKKLDRTFDRIQNNLFNNWLSLVNNLESEEI